MRRHRLLPGGAPSVGFAGRVLRHVQRSVAAAPGARTCLPKVSYPHGVPGAAVVGPRAEVDSVSSRHRHGQGGLRARLARLRAGCHTERIWMDTQIAEVTHLLSKAFTDYNLPIKAAAEVVADDFGNLLTASLPISGSVLPV
eukprot:jgi/Undpi1/11576/HiC_scaffold_30.g13872.m1